MPNQAGVVSPGTSVTLTVTANDRVTVSPRTGVFAAEYPLGSSVVAGWGVPLSYDCATAGSFKITASAGATLDYRVIDVPDDQGSTIPPALLALVLGAGTSEIYVQPDATGTWAARPSGLVVPIPTWARFLTLSICTSGGAGGSGRRGATLTARSGGAGGQPGVIAVFKIPLRDAVGALVAASGTLTVGASPAGGAAAATDDTSGNGSPIISNTTFVLNADSYLVAAGGIPAPGGTTVSVNHSGAPTYMFPPQTAAATSISANVALTYPSGPVSFGAPGGSISAADVLLTTGGVAVAQTGGSALQTLVAGANGSGFLRGNIFSAVGGAGGASSSSAAAQAGGNGIYGSGGGGGGASLNGFNSGAGGRGGAGWAVLVWE